MHEARLRGDTTLRLWGTGTPLREFLHADDLAEACVLLLERYSQAGHINVGSGEELTIRELAGLVAQAVGFTGRVEFDPAMPDGTPRKLMDVSRLRALGWKHRITMADGIRDAYAWYLANAAEARR
jgi:GDP-L-fucose synthase